MSASRPSRTVPLLLLLVALAGVAALGLSDRAARTAAEAAYGPLDQSLAAGNSLTADEVHQRLDRPPTRDYDAGEKRYVEEYEFRGVFHTYTVVVTYQSAATRLLHRVELR